MKKPCEKWKDFLLEAALTGATGRDMEEHLRSCEECAAGLKNLQKRKAQLDTLLPLVAQGADPSAGFRARVLAAAEAAGGRKRVLRWRGWTLVGTVATVVAVLVIGVRWHRGTEQKITATELEGAQKLAEWRAPSDGLMQTPGEEILRTTPRVGETYLNVPVRKFAEKKR